MRVLFVLPLLFLAGMFLCACESGTSSGNNVKIAVADVSRLMGDSAPGKAGIKFLEDRRAQFQKELDNIQEQLKKTPADDAAMAKLQKALATSQQQLQAEGQNVAGILFDTLQRVLDKFREVEGYTLILGQDTVASFDKAVDVTDAVMKELDKEIIDFKPLAPQAPVEIEIPESSKVETPATEGTKTPPDSTGTGQKAK